MLAYLVYGICSFFEKVSRFIPWKRDGIAVLFIFEEKKNPLTSLKSEDLDCSVFLKSGATSDRTDHLNSYKSEYFVSSKRKKISKKSRC